MKCLTRIQAVLSKVQYFFLILIFVTMITIMIAQVFWRYFLELPLTWSEEIARYLFIIVTYLGASIAVYEKSHIEINITEFLINNFIKNKKNILKINKIIDVIRNAAVLALSSIFSYYCFIYALEDYQFNQVSTSVGLPLYLVSGFIFLSMVVIIFYSFCHIVVTIREMIIDRSTI